LHHHIGICDLEWNWKFGTVDSFRGHRSGCAAGPSHNHEQHVGWTHAIRQSRGNKNVSGNDGFTALRIACVSETKPGSHGCECDNASGHSDRAEFISSHSRPSSEIVVKSAALYRPATKKGSAWFILEKALLYDGHSF
jgi:hypothetical protein